MIAIGFCLIAFALLLCLPTAINETDLPDRIFKIIGTMFILGIIFVIIGIAVLLWRYAP